MTSEHATAARDPIVVLAADEAFAMPLAVTVRSALDNLNPQRTLHIYVLDGGLNEATKARIVRSWSETRRFDVNWIAIDESALTGLIASDHVSMAAYYRILAARLLPKHIQKAIYLDSDLSVTGDLGALWEHDMAGQLCLAAQDVASPYMESRIALANYPKAGEYLVAARPVPNYEALGFEPTQPYFNSGVLLIDIAAWRREDIAAQLVECLRANEQYVRWWDQYALNVVLARRWGMLDPRWNQTSGIFQFPHWSYSPLDENTFQAVLKSPLIIHFNSPEKPWHAGCGHPFRRDFFRYLDRTEWQGWRPEHDLSLAERWQWKVHHLKSLLLSWKQRGRIWWDQR